MAYDETPFRTHPGYGEDGMQYNRFGIPIGPAATTAEESFVAAPLAAPSAPPAPFAPPAARPPAASAGSLPFAPPAASPAVPAPWSPAGQPVPHVWAAAPDGSWVAATPPGGVVVAGARYVCATWGQRVLACLIDVLPMMLVVWTLQALGHNGLGTLFQLSALAANTVYLQGTTGQSIGKRVAGIQVVRKVYGPSGERLVRPGPWLALCRQVAHLLDNLTLGIGYLAPIWTARRQTFADMAAQTVVLQVPRTLPLDRRQGTEQSATW